MFIDLHVHSTYSDGEKEPLEILEICNNSNVTTISITDHNNVLGVKEAISNNRYSNIHIIPGIEIDCYTPKGQLHILGYNIDLKNKKLNDFCKLVMEDDRKRLESLLVQLKKTFNLKFKDEDIQDIFLSKGSVGRPDIAKLCVKYGYAKYTQEAFTKLFNPVKENVIKSTTEIFDYECLNYIINAGGIASLAHPITLERDLEDLKKYLIVLKDLGLTGVEVYHSDQSCDFTNNLIEITNDIELLHSAGSDYHGPLLKPRILIGSGKNDNLNITNLSILSKITGEKNEKCRVVRKQ